MLISRHRVWTILVLPMICLSAASAADDAGEGRLKAVREVNGGGWRDRTLDSTAVDWSLFPKAYGILGSRRLMFPVDLSDWPARLGAERQLLIDNELIASATNVKRTIHQPVKYPGNPIMVGEEPWEKEDNLIVNQVIYDNEQQKFRMWYTTYRDFVMPENGRNYRYPTLYAESSDGVNWHRPKLGLLEHNGSKDNNWVRYGRMHGLVHRPDAKDPGQRFLGLFADEGPPGKVRGMYIFASPDGLRWSRVRDEPVVLYLRGDKTFPLRGLGDTSTVRWDPKLGKYVCDCKLTYGQKGASGKYNVSIRTRALLTSDDLVHWSAPRMLFYPDVLDGTDAQFYGHISFLYESQWIGMLRMYHFAKTDYKQVDVQLTSSRDGLNWSRVGNREVFLPLGEPGSWEPDYMDPAHNGPLLIGDELWFFYRGSRDLDKPTDNDYRFALGLAKLRRDGFASVDAGTEPGTLTTRPLTLSGNTLHINAVASGGSLKVGLAGMDGKPLPGFGIDDCVMLVGDGTDQIVRWKEKGDLSAAKERAEHIRLQFEMTNAELYSFWVE
jgi:hypothetical protein